MLNPSQVAQIEAVREKIAQIFSRNLGLNNIKGLEKSMDEILSLPELAILNTNQTAPKLKSLRGDYTPREKVAFILGAQITLEQIIDSAHFQRTIDKSEVK